jgi:hypothetical protein
VSASLTNRTWILTGSLENFRVSVERSQGQVRTVGEADAALLRERIDAAAVAA